MRSSLRTIFLLLSVLALSGCELRRGMYDQPKYLPYRRSEIFTDKRSVRAPIPGTIARGHLQDDELRYAGKVNGQVVDLFPFAIQKEDLALGQIRYNTYCTPCHDKLGTGNGMVVQRGYAIPPTFHQERLRKSPAGHFFDVISNGWGSMPSYGDLVFADDRWRIAAYVRALQMSQEIPLSSLTQQEQRKLREKAR
jgi:mono/diheme cytochrome c family protein